MGRFYGKDAQRFLDRSGPLLEEESVKPPMKLVRSGKRF